MFVVTLPPSAASDPSAFARKAQAAGADMLELRGDLTPGLQAFDSALPLLVSPRGAGQAWIDRFDAAYVDLELDEQGTCPASATLIRSVHDYHGTPDSAKLTTFGERLKKSGAAIIKIAVTIHAYADLRRLLEWQQERNDPKGSVILGMGPKAHLSRMLSPMRNALTYTYLDEGDQAAPGQVPLAWYQRTRHCRDPQIFGILGGKQVASSLSPLIHNTLFASSERDALYTVFPTDDLADAWTNLTALGVRGFSVTAPWKKEIIGHLDELDPLAHALESVNTVVKRQDEWIGCNTDMIGFRDAYKFLQTACTVAVIGSGGVVPAVLQACRELDAGTVTLYARNETERRKIALQFGIDAHPIPATLPEYEAVIWTVPDDATTTLSPTAKRGVAIDLRYGKPTAFLAEAAAKGYQTHDGLPMLLLQAYKQCELLAGMVPSDASLRYLRTVLDRRRSAAPPSPTP